MTETTSDTAMENEAAPAVKTEVKVEKTETSDTAMENEAAPAVKTEVKAEKTETSDTAMENEADPAVKVEKTEAATNGSTKESQPESGGAKTEKVPITVKEENLLDEEIVYQIHYYFGNINLPKDKFLQEQIKLNEGWVPLEVLLKFHRLAELSKDTSVILAALRTQDKPLMEISEDGTMIRRSPAYPLPELNEDWRKSLSERTVYCKGFPQTGVAIGELIKFFKKFGQVDSVQKRTYIDKKDGNKTIVFKGSTFTTFDTKETAEKFLALESVKFGDTELIRKFQNNYFEDKRKERDEKWGRKPKKDKSDKQGAKEEKAEEVDSCPRGCILHLVGFPTENPIDRDVIREKVTEAGGDVAYITYNRGDTEAYIRLQGDDEKPALKLLESIPDKKLKINETELAATVLEGDEETDFLKKSLEDRDRRRGRNRGRGGFRGKKRRGDGDHGPARKSFKRSRD